MKTKRFKPNIGQTYYFIELFCNTGSVHEWLFTGDRTEKIYLKAGNCFEHKYEAQAKLREIKKILKERL